MKPNAEPRELKLKAKNGSGFALAFAFLRLEETQKKRTVILVSL